MNRRTNAGGELYYKLFLVPMWRGQLDKLDRAARNFRHHLLALECLRVAIGPGTDPLKVSEFCKKWKWALTAPVVGPTAILRRVGKGTAAAAFDITGAISLGVKLVAEMGPLIGKIQMDRALLVAFDVNAVPTGDQGQVGGIIEKADTPENLLSAVKQSKDELQKTWDETVRLAERMEEIRLDLGLPPDQI